MTLFRVAELLPAGIVPESVPPKVPVPIARLSVTTVSAATLTGVPLPSCACTETLNGAPAVGLTPPLTEVIASLPVALAVNVTGLPARPAADAVTVYVPSKFPRVNVEDAWPVPTEVTLVALNT